ncbi:UNVERIFIED_CONTAM: hypothetical protein Scaly_0594600 [Sesamum calycinum]|uniref:RNase H type-1 domain-containing protein n=1 Tax=Sesamum calycinum TaxID=2727403 RepID=A0AAW2RUC8_9LAMI
MRNQKLEAEHKEFFISKERDYKTYRKVGINEGKKLFYSNDEYKEVAANSRLRGARAFMKSLVFDYLVDMKVLLSITKDGKSEDYLDISAEEEISLINEFYSLLARIPLYAIGKEAQHRLISRVVVEEGLKIEVVAPEEPLIVKGFNPATLVEVSTPIVEVLNSTRAPSILYWSAPSPSWFKLNTNGSFLGNLGLAGAANIIRDSNGHVHLAYQFVLGTGTSVLAEFTTVWQGMEFALTHGLAPLVVEVDATTVISLLKSRASGMWEVQHLIMRIVRLQQLLLADVQQVFREANGAAGHLAKEVASLQLTRVLHHDDITVFLRGILCLDRQGVPHLRRG